MNNKALLLLLIIAGLALAGLITRRGELLALSVPFLSFLFIGLMQAPGNVVLRVSRVTDKTSAPAGESVEIALRFANLGDALANVRFEDALPPSARLVEGQTRQTLCLAAGEEGSMRYKFTGSRGICLWKSVEVAAADPLGLFEARINLPAPGEVIMRPVPVGLDEFPFRPRRTLHSTGSIPVPLAGSGTDFLGIREYRPGDALRRINWRLAARHPGRLFTNEQERHEVGDFGIILDARQAEEDVFERAVSAAASLAERILREGNRLSMLVFGRYMTAAFPGFGKRHLSVILRGLAGASPSANVPLDYLDYFPARLFPSQAVLVMISSPRPNDSEMYARLRAAGYEVLLVSPDDIGHAARRQGQAGDHQIAIRAARIERRATLLGLSRLGVHIVDWNLNESLGAALEALAPHMVHRRNLLA